MGGRGSGGRRCHLPPPPASWPAAAAASQATSGSASRRSQGDEVASRVPSWSGFDEDFEVHLPGRGGTTFFVRVAGRGLAATKGVAVVFHGGGFTGMSWAPAAGVMKRDCCVLAPDLRRHGLTTSRGTSASTDALKEDSDGENRTSVGDGDGEHGGGEEGGEDGADAFMSVENLTEDMMSLLVEIFTSGVLSQPQLPSRQQQQQQQEPLREDPPPRVPSETPMPVDDSNSKTDIGTMPVSSSTTNSRTSSPDDSNHGSSNKSGDAAGDVPATAEEGYLPPLSPGGRKGGTGGGGGGGHNSPIKLLLVGHSLGGSIAVRVAGAAEELNRRCMGAAEVVGVVAVDVVEGTALAALDDMPEILRKIPRSFPRMEDAILWHVKTGAVRNSASAHAVVPSRLKRDQHEEGEESERVVWRTDLRATRRHWRGWFEGMSKAFLDLSIPKLLVVAGMDRLDTELTAAHMQGRFQLKLVYGCGHSVQEDQPDETAASIVNFALRNSIFRRASSGGSKTGGRAGEEEELRRKLARARVQANYGRR